MFYTAPVIRELEGGFKILLGEKDRHSLALELEDDPIDCGSLSQVTEQGRFRGGERALPFQQGTGPVVMKKV